MSYNVKTSIFEGPFDLLVYLIESSKMNIYDINISEITEQYMEYIFDMNALDVELAIDFTVLAATLIQIKSKMLLPKAALEQGDREDDPRDELVEMILEYKKYKKAAEFLKEQERINSMIHTKPQEDLTSYIEKMPEESLLLDPNNFIKAFRVFLEKKKQINDVQRRYDRVRGERMTMETKSAFVINTLRKKKKLYFNDLIENISDLYDVVLTFSTLLELMSKSKIQAYQENNYEEIAIIYQDREAG